MKNLLTSKVKDVAITRLGVSDVTDLSQKALTDLVKTQAKNFAKDQLGVSRLDTNKLALAATQKVISLGSDLAKEALSKVSQSSLSPAMKHCLK